MTAVERILQNILVLYGARVVGQVLNLGFFVLAARYLGPGEFGTLSFALSLGAISKIVSDSGLRHLLTREVSRERPEATKFLVNSSVVKIGLSVVMLVLIAAVVTATDQSPRTALVVYLVAASIVLDSFAEIQYSLFQAFERMEYQAFAELLKRSVLLLGTLVAVQTSASLVDFGAIYVVASTIPLVSASVVTARRFVEPRVQIDWGYTKSLLVRALPFGISVMFITTRFNVDILVLNQLASDDAVAWFNAVYRIILATLFVPRILMRAVYPVFARQYGSSEKALGELYERILKYMLALAVPLGVGGVLAAEELILGLYGEGYRNAVLLFELLVWTAALMFLNNVFETLLNSVDRQKSVTLFAGITMGLNVVLDVVLVSLYGYVGAAVGTVVADFGLLVMYTYAVGPLPTVTSPVTVVRRHAPRILAAVGVMCVGYVAISGYGGGVAVSMVASVLVYPAAYYFVGGIRREELSQFKCVISNSR